MWILNFNWSGDSGGSGDFGETGDYADAGDFCETGELLLLLSCICHVAVILSNCRGPAALERGLGENLKKLPCGAS